MRKSFLFYFPAVSEDQAAPEEPGLTDGWQILQKTKMLWEGVKTSGLEVVVKKERQMFSELPLDLFGFSTSAQRMSQWTVGETEETIFHLHPVVKWTDYQFTKIHQQIFDFCQWVMWFFFPLDSLRQSRHEASGSLKNKMWNFFWVHLVILFFSNLRFHFILLSSNS